MCARPRPRYWIGGGGVSTCTTITTTTQSCNSAIGSPPTVAGTPDVGGMIGRVGPFLAVNKQSDQSSGNVGFFQVGLAGVANSVSFYWGSVDTWNFAQLLDAQGNALDTVTGTALGASFNNGVPMSPGGGEFTFNWDGTDPVATLQFGDTFGPAMEVADVSTVPEPDSIGLIAVGLGLVGVARWQRRTRRV